MHVTGAGTIRRLLFFALAAATTAFAGQPGRDAVNAGTAGAALPNVAGEGGGQHGMNLVILGSMAPGNAASRRYVAEAVREVNLLGPTAVFTLGNLVAGETRSEQRYAEEVEEMRGSLGTLKMPWYPCVGETDVVPGTRDVGGAGDRRFEGLYQKKMGPLYYSVDVGSVHVIVLDSEENLDPFGVHAISEQQRAWLKADLNRTFERASGMADEDAGDSGKTKYVVLLLHRPLWREKAGEGGIGGGAGGGHWNAVHRMLVQFNERPIVSVEGNGAVQMGGTGPRVVGVYAAAPDESGYALEPTRDGIRYTMLGPVAARMMQDASIMPRHFTLLRFGGDGGDGMHAAMVRLITPDNAPAIDGDQMFTAGERDVLDQIAAIPNEVMGVQGVVDDSDVGGAMRGTLVMHVGNPLDVPLDVELRLASTRNLATTTERDNANPFVENFDAPWQMDIPHQIRHLAPGARESWPMSLTWGAGAFAVKAPPQVEFVVHWRDPRGAGAREAAGGEEGGRVCTVVLKRRVPVVPHAEVPVVATVSMDSDEGWASAAQGEAYAWDPRHEALQQTEPEWEMTADGENVYVRVRVVDGTKSYSPAMDLDWRYGGIASDAVSVAWSRSDAAEAQRIWVVPFGPKGVELWRNEGFGVKQTTLRRLDAAAEARVKTAVAEEPGGGGYRVTVALPRGMLFGNGGEASGEIRMNVATWNNDEGARTWVRSWAKDELGPAAWGQVTLRASATTQGK
ncbi:MAG TPA: hypothetical protein VM008_12935 [Phycisphaerae bacterium]|nr:hypothetical protein [Phycisphaerae bacterium]